ncbi:MAG: hypothetical protein HC849_00455 [Oscillatoriales cyanobacterium RU_3_3]|nr:hypothetical protein [Microcoleus sp. SU_5_3]NJM59005.1 hypothetical protein [Oscillatoriales cyanobacterium RU_3_3]NJR76107.1 hypothetical protein [Scytonema sp. CRU_2_7]
MSIHNTIDFAIADQVDIFFLLFLLYFLGCASNPLVVMTRGHGLASVKSSFGN